ncbi:MAG: DUF354 domain-containing protein [Oscillospiraceae bacterium]|jgi:predicted glycosyltransferase
MTIVVDIGHPSHAHFFKNFITVMLGKGHKIIITASEKDIAPALLKAFGFEFINLGSYGNSLLGKILNAPVMDFKMYKAVKYLKPDIFLGFGSVRAAHAAWLLNRPSIIFDGDSFTYPFYRWFASTVCAFSGYDISGKNIVSINGYKELAYLHPRWFEPDAAVMPRRPAVLLRFVSRAFHELGKMAFDEDFKIKLVLKLEKYADVYISSEGALPDSLERYRLKIKPEEMHSFLSGASLLVTDSGTMTVEAALLGVPVVRCDSFIGGDRLGVFQELENKYGLVYSFWEAGPALLKAVELACTPDAKALWEKKRQRLLREKIDVTSFMVWFVENYPNSIAMADTWKAGDLIESGPV